MPPKWVRVRGDGMAVRGPCLLLGVIVFNNADADWSDIYDGLDLASGKKFCRIESATSTTRHLRLGAGVAFDRGVYVNGKNDWVETTVIFEPLPE